MQTQKLYKQQVFVFILLLCFSFISQAATITAIADGNWADGTTWDSGVAPTNADDVIIPSGITVTGTSISSANFISLTVSGTLDISGNFIVNDWQNDPITITETGKIIIGGNLDVDNTHGGPFIVNSGGLLEITGDIQIANNEYIIDNYGFIEVDGSVIGTNFILNNHENSSLLVHTNISGDGSNFKLYNWGIITVDNDLTMVNVTLENKITGKIIVFGDMSLDGTGSGSYINAGFVQSDNFYFKNITSFSNTGTTVVLLEFNVSWTGCPCNDGDWYLNTLVLANPSATACDDVTFSSCEEEWLSTNNVTKGRKLWLNAGFIGYGQEQHNDKIDRWYDLANQYGFKMHQDDVLKQPSLNISSTQNINFNPVVSYDGIDINTILDDPDGENLYFEPNPNDGFGVFAVILPKSTGEQFAFDYGTYATEGYGLMYSEDTYKMYTPTSHGGAESSLSPHGRGAAPTLLTQTTTWNGNQLLYVNGAQEQSDAVTLTKIEGAEITPSTSRFTVGGQCNTPINYDFDGSIAELIIYQIGVDEATRKSTESFLALKYGIPLPHEYTDYYNNIIFNDAVYNNSIIGLAREDLNLLKQKQSTNIYNVGTAGNLTLSTDIITEYDQRNITTDIIENSSYFVCGHNGQPAESGRIYKVQTTNFDQQVTLQFDFSGLTLPYPSLFVSSDDSFATSTEITADSYIDDKLVYTVTFTDNAVSYFKMDDVAITSPGGVSDSLQMWLTATEIAATHNDPVASWTDYTGNLGDAVSTNLASPTFLHSATDNINYNPTVNFDGTDDGLDFGSSFFDAPLTNDGVTLFAVTAPGETSNITNQYIFDLGLNTTHGTGLAYGYEDATFYTGTANGGADQSIIHTKKNTPTIISGNALFSDKQYLSINGKALLENAITLSKLEEGVEFTHSATHDASAGPVTIGTQSATGGSGNYFTGKIAEVIAYNKTLTNTESQKVETYLAIKHGISLSKNYVNSEDVIIWNFTGNTGYNNDIIGVGKDMISLLNQKQSHSSNETDILSIGAGSIAATNEANPTDITNLSSLLCGHNDSIPIALDHTNKPTTVQTRIGRVWKVQETNDVGTVEVRFTLDNHGSVTVGDLVLIIDTDQNGVFEDTDNIVATAMQDGDDFYFSAIDFADGDFFTLGSTNSTQTPLRPTVVSKPGVGINTEAIHTTAQLHIEATDKGVLLPKLTTAQMNAISNPPTGLLLFNADENRYMYNAGTPALPQWQFVGKITISNSALLSSESGAYNGEIRYNTTTNTLWYWTGTLWQELQDE
jgi:hypothetical protein